MIVAFGFSKDGKANPAIAGKAEYLSKYFGDVPIFTQGDVARYFYSKALPVTVADESERYLSTLGIINSLRAIAEKQGWKTALVLAAPCHEWRCARDLRKSGFKVSTGDYLRSYPKAHWYHREDSQLWVRNPRIWWAREVVLRLLPWGLYARIAA